jgi:predicted nucleic acid-binding protein
MFVDTSVWSLAYRHDHPGDDARVEVLSSRLRRGHPVWTTGIVAQELLQGQRAPKHRAEILRAFDALTWIVPERDDHLDAAAVHNRCRRGGVQIETVDALIAALCIRRGLELLTADADFRHAARHVPLEVWEPT